MTDTFDPYYEWLAIPLEDQPPHYYRLLGLRPFEANEKVIGNAAIQRIVHLRTFQNGPRMEHSQRLLNEVSAARICLLNAEKKAAYDAQLRTALAAPPPMPTPAALGSRLPVALPASHERAARAAVDRHPRPRLVWPWLAMIAVAGVVFCFGIVAALLNLNGKGEAPPQAAAQPAKAVPKMKAVVVATPAPPAIESKAEQAAPRAKGKPSAVPHPDKPPPPPAVGSGQPASAGAKTVPATAAVARSGKDAPAAPPAGDEPPIAIPGPAASHSAPDSAALPDASGGVAAPSAAPATKVHRQPMPAAEVQASIAAQVEEIYKLADATTPAQQHKLAEDLIATAETSKRAEEQFVLLRKASELAVKAGAAALAFEIVDRMTKQFELDAFAVKQSLLFKMADAARTPERLDPATAGACALIDEVLATRRADRFEFALKVCQASKNAAFRRALADRSREITALQKQAEEEQQVLEAVHAKPDDPDANLAAGRLFCLRKDDWDQGLPYLAKGSDAVCKALATDDLAAKPTQTPDKKARGDAWWDAAEKADGEDRSGMRRRAVSWYTSAVATLPPGLDKAQVEKRLQQVADEQSPPAAPAAKAPLPAPMKLNPNAVTRTAEVGGSQGSHTGNLYEDLPRPARLLVGFNVSVSSVGLRSIRAVQPIYQGPPPAPDAAVYGKPRGPVVTIEAKKGYAVGGIVGKGGLHLDGFRVIFMRVGRAALDPADSYESEWLGGSGNGSEQKLGGDGTPIIGIYGRSRSTTLYSLGLIQALQSATPVRRR